MTQELLPIECAPKDGTIINLFNTEFDVNMTAYWNKKRKQWEGTTYGTLGVIKIKWDKDSHIQPTHFCRI